MAESNDLEGQSSGPARSISGWDGKLRVDPSDINGGPNDHSPPQSEGEDEDEGEDIATNAPVTAVNGEQIDADEDLLEDLPADETDLDLNHCRITSIPALRLERFPNIERFCLRQNQIANIKFPEGWGQKLDELDLYDNAISHVKGLDELTQLTSLDLSFNNIKHIKRVKYLKGLTSLYFVQNKISRIEELEGLSGLTNLELGANRIREIENLDSLSNLRQLWLGKNKITELKNLSTLHNLRLLSIQANRLTSASLEHLRVLPNLTELYISHNALESISALASCPKLTTIDISSNPITSIRGLKPLADLEEFWASDCQIESFQEMEEELGDKAALNTVYFEGNPVQTKQKALYRNKVKLALPQVKQIDATYTREA